MQDNIIFVIIIAAIIAIATYVFKQTTKIRKSQLKKKVDSLFPHINPRRWQIIKEAWRIIKYKYPKKAEVGMPRVYLCNDLEKRIFILGNQSLSKFRKNWQAPPEGYVAYAGVYIPPYHAFVVNAVEYSRENELGFICIHEMLHSLGLKHGEEMELAEDELFDKLKMEFKW